MTDPFRKSTPSPWVDLLYTDCVSRVVVNGNVTDTFQVQAGVRQGCPLSVVLFILAMEPLACAIRQDSSIRGLVVPGSGGKEAKMTVYMDDMTLLCSTNSSVVRALGWSDCFSKASGAKLNRAKSEILYLNWREPKLELGLKETDDRLKILGVEIGKDMEKVNWEKRLPGIKWKLLQWEDRDLTITGKVLVVNAEVLASLTFLAATLPAPRSFVTLLVRAIFQFIWGTKQENLKREIMYKPLEKGGKAVPKVEVKLNALFLTPILNAVLKSSNDSLWNSFAKFWVGRDILTRVGRRPPLDTPHAETRPRLYDRALALWETTRLSDPPLGEVSRRTVERGLCPQVERMVPVGIMIEDMCVQVWRNVNSPFLSNANKDLAWKAVHSCLPTRVWLKRRQSARSPQCPRSYCGGEESVRHVFWACSFAQGVWGLVMPWLKLLFREPGEIYILYGNLNRGDRTKWDRWWAVINCMKEGLWRSRNLVVFKEYYLQPEAVVKVGLTLVRDYILSEKKKHSEMELKELWKIGDGFLSNVVFDVF